MIALLAMIQGYCCQIDALNDKYVGLVRAIKNLLYFFQKPMQSNLDYHKRISLRSSKLLKSTGEPDQ
jgi:hypothetical protein